VVVAQSFVASGASRSPTSIRPHARRKTQDEPPYDTPGSPSCLAPPELLSREGR
jgi:hypothetical protein